MLRLVFDFEPGAISRARDAGVRFLSTCSCPDGEQLGMLGSLAERRAAPGHRSGLPLAQTKEALAYCEDGHAVGKVVIEVAQVVSPRDKTKPRLPCAGLLL